MCFSVLQIKVSIQEMMCEKDKVKGQRQYKDFPLGFISRSNTESKSVCIVIGICNITQSDDQTQIQSLNKQKNIALLSRLKSYIKKKQKH